MNTPNSNLAETKSVLLKMASETAEFKAAVGGSLADVAADWVLSLYLPALRSQLVSLPDGPERMKLLRLAANDFVAFQRGGNGAARLFLERDRLAFERVRHERATDAKFWKWTKRPDVNDKLRPPNKGGLTTSTLQKIQKELHLM